MLIFSSFMTVSIGSVLTLIEEITSVEEDGAIMDEDEEEKEEEEEEELFVSGSAFIRRVFSSYSLDANDGASDESFLIDFEGDFVPSFLGDLLYCRK